MNRITYSRPKCWYFIGIFMVSLLLLSFLNIDAMNPIHFEPLSIPKSQADLSYYRWGSTWGGENVDRANDVWANGESSFTVGTIDINTTAPKLMLSRYSNVDWSSGTQDWNVTWSDGNPIYGAAIWGTPSNTTIYTAGTSTNQLILIKWDNNGTEIWNSSWSLSGNFGQVHAIWGIEDNIYMTGTYIDDLLLISWNKEGTQLWNKTWGGVEWEEGYDIWGIENEIYTVGSTSSYGEGLNDSLIVKWDTDGNQIWNQTWGNVTEEYYTSVFGYENEIYICGNAWNEYHNSSAAAVLKYGSNGTVLWENWWNGLGNESAYGIWANEFYVYVAASTNSWDPITDKMVLLKWSYSGIYVDSSWLWWSDDRQYIPNGIFGWDYNIYVCGWQNFTPIAPDDYDQFLFNFYSYYKPPVPWFEPPEPNPSLNGTYNLTWQEFPEAESYRLYRDIYPIEDIIDRSPYKITTNSSILETNMAEGTYFYIVTSVVKGVESDISNPGIVEVNLPDPPKEVPGYSIFITIPLIGITTFWIYKKKFRKN